MPKFVCDFGIVKSTETHSGPLPLKMGTEECESTNFRATT